MKSLLLDTTGYESGVILQKGRASVFNWARSENHTSWCMALEGILGIQEITLTKEQRKLVMKAAIAHERRMGIPDPRPSLHKAFQLGDRLIVTLRGWD